MKDNLFNIINNFWQTNIVQYIDQLRGNPIRIILLIIDLSIVIYLIYKLIQATKKLRVWQLVKGIAVLVAITLIIRVDSSRYTTLYINFNYDIWSYSFNCYIPTRT